MKNKYITSTIINIERETPKVRTFTLNISIKAKPGQFVMVWIPGIHEKPFSIVCDKPLILSIAKVGLFTKKIHNLKKGDKITFRGPYGKSFKIKGKKIILVGGGYGVVPLYFLASSITLGRRKYITAVIGAKTKSELVFVSKFRRLGCRVKIATDNGSAGFKGFTTDLTERLLKKTKSRQTRLKPRLTWWDSIYTCGPEIMMKKIAKIASGHKIFCQVSIERMIKCAVGICGECHCKGKLVCKDGPVFNGKILL